MSSAEHQARAAELVQRQPVRCAVVTVSDTRRMDNDEGGATLARLLEEAGHLVVERVIVRDDPAPLRERLLGYIADAGVHAVLCTGGTGIGRRDGAVEVVRALLTVELEGFGELFRMLSWEQVGAAAMMSRALGGLVERAPEAGGDTLVFAMPGSVNAVETATCRLIAPQLAHLVWERRR